MDQWSESLKDHSRSWYETKEDTRLKLASRNHLITVQVLNPNDEVLVYNNSQS